MPDAVEHDRSGDGLDDGSRQGPEQEEEERRSVAAPRAGGDQEEGSPGQEEGQEDDRGIDPEHHEREVPGDLASPIVCPEVVDQLVVVVRPERPDGGEEPLQRRGAVVRPNGEDRRRRRRSPCRETGGQPRPRPRPGTPLRDLPEDDDRRKDEGVDLDGVRQAPADARQHRDPETFPPDGLVREQSSQAEGSCERHVLQVVLGMSDELRHYREHGLGQQPDRNSPEQPRREPEDQEEEKGRRGEDRQVMSLDGIADEPLLQEKARRTNVEDVEERPVMALERDEPVLQPLHAGLLPLVQVEAPDVLVELLVPRLAVAAPRGDAEGREGHGNHQRQQEQLPPVRISGPPTDPVRTTQGRLTSDGGPPGSTTKWKSGRNAATLTFPTVLEPSAAVTSRRPSPGPLK